MFVHTRDQFSSNTKLLVFFILLRIYRSTIVAICVFFTSGYDMLINFNIYIMNSIQDKKIQICVNSILIIFLEKKKETLTLINAYLALDTIPPIDILSLTFFQVISLMENKSQTFLNLFFFYIITISIVYLERLFLIRIKRCTSLFI